MRRVLGLLGLVALVGACGPKDYPIGSWDLWSRDGARVDLRTTVDRLTYTEFGYVDHLVGTEMKHGTVETVDDWSGQLWLRYDDGTEWRGTVGVTSCPDRPFPCRSYASGGQMDIRAPRPIAR